jgi:hypothetical protein
MTATADRTSQACDLFRAAYDNRYTWDDGFPGYAADFELEIGHDAPLGRSGDKVLKAGIYLGSVQVPADLTDLNGIVVSGVNDPLAAEWVVNQIKDVITHRKRADFESAHGKHEFSLDGQPDASGAVPIAVSGDAMGSHYKVKHNEVVQVSRTMGRMAFTINHLDKLDTGSGYVSTAYTAVFNNPETGEILNQLKFSDRYVEFAGYYLMSEQVVKGTSRGKPSYTRVSFSNFREL